MIKLEGITKIRDKIVVLENIENPVLKKVLHFRLRGDRFNFWHSENYSEYTDNDPSKHVDKHSDSYTKHYGDSSHTDETYNSQSNMGYRDGENYYNDHMESHRDKGHSDTVSYGYSEHTDHY